MANRIVIGVLALVAIGSLTFAIVGANSHQNTPAEVRINARPLADGRIEFALQQRNADGSWGDRQLPRVRKLPANARVDRWLSSSPVSLDGSIVPPIISPFFLSRQVSGIHTAGDLAFSAQYTGYDLWEWPETLVWLTGSTDYGNLVAQLTLKCTGGSTNFGSYDEDSDSYEWVPGVLSGWITLHTPRVDSFTRHPYDDSDSPIVVTVHQPRQGDHSGPPPGVPEMRRWTFDEAEWVNGDVLDAMGVYDWITVQVVDVNGSDIAASFSLQRLMSTPVQANLDHCRKY